MNNNEKRNGWVWKRAFWTLGIHKRRKSATVHALLTLKAFMQIDPTISRFPTIISRPERGTYEGSLFLVSTAQILILAFAPSDQHDFNPSSISRISIIL